MAQMDKEEAKDGYKYLVPVY